VLSVVNVVEVSLAGIRTHETDAPLLHAGYGPSDAESVKRHPFFKSINWDDLLRRNIPAPFVPNISNNLDVSNFSVEFTDMPPVDSPADVPVAFDVFKVSIL
jgi:ribosomal protein S6 kinase alpha-5